jgi:RNA polymerase-associated protein LEO1
MADAAVDAGISDNEHHDTAGETGADDTNGGDLRDTVEEAGLEGEVDDDDLFGDGGDDNEEQPA